MLKITLYQMRRNIGRLIAAGIAIAIGTAFIAATFVGGDVLVNTTNNALTVARADSDLSVDSNFLAEDTETHTSWGYEPFSPQEVERIRALDGVDEVNFTSGRDAVNLEAGAKSEYVSLALAASSPKLQVVKISEGKAPAATNEIAVPKKILDRLELKVGDALTLLNVNYYAVDLAVEQGKTYDEATELATTRTDLVVTGVTDDYRGAFTYTSGAALMTEEGWVAIQTTPVETGLETGEPSDQPTEFFADMLLIAAKDGVDIPTLQADINEITGKRQAFTKAEVAENQMYNATGEVNIVMTFILVFAALALFVAGLVITNTFQVLVAQRAKTLALLRCVGANKKQIRNSVLVEAGILGFLSSVAGIILGLGLMQATLSILRNFEFARSLQEWISIPLTAIWVPLLAGTVVTVLASLVPARIATKVSPLAALRPQEGSGEATKKAGRVRLVFALLLVLGGAALIGLGFTLNSEEVGKFEMALLSGIAGGMLTFIGLIISSVMWVPKAVGAIGKLFAVGASSKLAQANTIRNPRRTAATATALFIGVTLVAMMSVGAATARSTFNSMLDGKFPIDIMAQSWSSSADEQINQETLDRIKSIDGVEAAGIVKTIGFANVYVPPVPGPDGYPVGGDMSGQITGISPETAREVLRTPELADKFDDNTVLMNQWGSEQLEGSTARFYVYDMQDDSDWEPDPTKQRGFDDGIEFTVSYSPDAGETWFVTPKVLDQISALEKSGNLMDSPSIIIKVKDVKNAGATVDALRDLFDEDSMYFTGAVMERLHFEQMIDIILLVLVGLLAVAVIIALIGVANTLSLSVIERRRESATLRAIGMSKKQLKRSLGIEGMLIAGIGAFLGIVLGIGYAAIGSTLMLGGFADVQLSVRWVDLAAILGVSLIAGLLASVMPARGAANTSPVEALAMD